MLPIVLQNGITVEPLEGKKYKNNSQSHVFLRSSKIADFSTLLRSREGKGAIFKLRKKACSNAPFI